MKTIEFFTDHSNLTRHLVNVQINGEYTSLAEMDINDVNIILMKLLLDEDARRILSQIAASGVTDNRERLMQFALCNWGKLDNIPDFEDDGFTFEYVNCGHKAPNSCPHNHKFCIIKTRIDEQFNRKHTA